MSADDMLLADHHPYTGRENAVPCQEIGCRRVTWRDDALCVRHAENVGRVASPAGPAPVDGGDASPPYDASPPPTQRSVE